MMRQLTPAEKRKAMRRLILLGIPAIALLWASGQRVFGYLDGEYYIARLRYGLLSDYKLKHNHWPASLEDIERDLEAEAYAGPEYVDRGDNGDIKRTFHKYRPVLTVIWQTQSRIEVDIRFTRCQSFESRVYADSALNSEADPRDKGPTDEKPTRDNT